MLLVLIPARGGSRRLPGKNVRKLGGKPLIVRTVELATSVFADQEATIWVSTDCSEIANVAREAGADVPFLRPPELATDTATSIDVARHALDEYTKRRDKSPDTLLLLQPTSPFRRPEHITTAVDLLSSDLSIDAVVGVERAHVSARFTFRSDNGLLQPIVPEAFDDEDVLLPNGAIFLIRVKAMNE